MYKNLIKAMEDNHVTRQQLADLLGVAYNTISDRLNGKTKFLFWEASRIRKCFFPALDIEYLFTFEDDSNAA